MPHLDDTSWRHNASQPASRAWHETEALLQAVIRRHDDRAPQDGSFRWRVAEMSARLARTLGWNEERCRAVRYGALLHELGSGIALLAQIAWLQGPGDDGGMPGGERLLVAEREDAALLGTVLDCLEAGTLHTGPSMARSSGFSRTLPPPARLLQVAIWFERTLRSLQPGPEAPALAARSLLSRAGYDLAPEVVDAFLDLWERGGLDDLLRAYGR